jgi:uncharacterized membrane protein
VSDVPPPPPEPPPSPPAPPPAAPSLYPTTTDEKTMPIVVYALYLGGFLTGGLTTVIGFIIALASRASAPPMAETHYRFQIRTGAVTLALGVLATVIFIIGVPLMFVLIGFAFFKLAGVLWALAALYMLVRSIIGLIRAANGEPYPTPDNWLV